jgi:hypothetical protein
VRDVLAEQLDLRADGANYVPVDQLPPDHRYWDYQRTVNQGGAPSEQIVDLDRTERGEEYRDETEGEHPIDELRTRRAS